ncbi:parallel beta helix pectate lyase-like protein [Streptomyces sp. 846.5]|nr:NEW3 domain-containing protein [Streptomyces sp. 846.5]TDU03465.1 parallel beta helix pectate lyase-like protein [Streptomyces sp. 846.5]
MPTAVRLAALISFGLAVCGVTAAPAGAATQPRPTSLYASPTGHGSACTAAAPCSLGSAATRVRALDRNMTADIDVDLYGGDYRLTAPLQLGPQDSGSNGFQVVYRPVRDQQPVLNGAVRVSGFTEVAGSELWSAPVPASATAGQQLFVDGTRATLARSAGSPPGLQTTATGFRTSDAAYAGFTQQSQIEVVQDNDWKHMSCPVQSITADPAGGSDINVLPSCWAANHVNVPNLGFPFNGAGLPGMDGVSYVENAYQLLGQAGQFYLDKVADRLYYLPRPGQDMHAADVELPVLQTLVSLNGTPGHLVPVNQDAPGVNYAGSSWGTSAARGSGDLGNDVAYATTDGDSVSYTFTGSGLEVLGETNSDEGSFNASVDGVADTRKNWTGYGSTRMAQQVLYSVQGLAPGTHTVKLTKAGGAYLVVDAFETTPQAVAPVHDIAFQGIGFAYSTWNLPVTTGYIDNQAAVLWDTSGPTTTPVVTPGAVAVSRGDDITFSGDSFNHLGATGVDLADGTRNSTVTGSTVTDTAAGGISVGDVDDYFQRDPALMDSGNTVSDNTISHVGQVYTDAVGVWAGYTRDLRVDHNDIGHTSYSGMSLGWGWGWASPCSMQAAQGISSCARGSNYAGGNRITDNFIHDVMNVLYDGGPIYTNGGQGEDGAGIDSVFSGNYVTVGNHTNNMLYQDEGSSYWDTFGNVTSLGGNDWIGMWTPTINNITVGPTNYTDNPNTNDNGTDIAYTAPTLVAAGAWPAAALAVMRSAGPMPATPAAGTVGNDSPLLGYTGTWSAAGAPGGDDQHSTSAQGATVSLAFTGTSVALVAAEGPNQGSARVLVDGVSRGAVDTYSASPETGQTVFTDTRLSPGPHTIQVVATGSGRLTVDSFQVPAMPSLRVSGAPTTFHPGTAFTVTATVADPGPIALTGVRLGMSVPQGWTVSRRAQPPAVPPHGSGTATFSVTAPAGLQPAGPIALTVTASYRGARGTGRTVLTTGIQVQQPYPSLAAAYDNTGVSDDTATGSADIDGSQSSLSAQALAAAGVAPGAALTYGGIGFTWPTAASGQPDNATAGGQTVDLTGSGAELGFLDTATYGPASGGGLITYTDGTTQNFTLSVPDWYGSAPAGSHAVIVCAYRNRPGNIQDHTTVNVYEQTVALAAGKTVASVTLPDIGNGAAGGQSALHVFALGIGG